MRTISAKAGIRAGLAALALAGAGWSNPALAQAGYVIVPRLATSDETALPAPLTASQAISLCPGLDGNPDAFGMAREQGDGALETIGARARSLGLDVNRAIYTSWSGKLAAMEFYRDVPRGAARADWRVPLDAALVAEGWEPTDDVSTDYDAPGYLRAIETTTGTRTYKFEIDHNGHRRGIMLRCGDEAMLALDAKEQAGNLAPGSARPQLVEDSVGLEQLLAQWDCADPALLTLIAQDDDSEIAGPLIVERLGPLIAASQSRSRLVKWLRWTMLQSGKIDEQTIRAIEDKLASDDPRDLQAGSLAIMVALGHMREAAERKDPAARCRAIAGLGRLLGKEAEDEARRDAALAAALVREGERRGVALD